MNIAVDAICHETNTAIRALMRQSNDRGDSVWTSAARTKFEDAVRHYRRALMQVARVPGKQATKKQKMGEEILLASFNARLCAVLRGLERFKLYVSPSEAFDIADRLTAWKPIAEHVVASWHPKGSGGYRLICQDGLWRTAQRLLVRDMYSLMGIEADFDFSRKGAGGEKALVDHVCKHITSGYDWWVSTDIKNCFPSLRPAHFDWLPIDARLLKNVVFLPKCAKVKVVIPKDPKAVIDFLQASYPDHDVTTIDEMAKFTVQMVRQGLSQGSVLSPLLARGFVGRELRASLGGMKVAPASWVDDAYIGAHVRKDVQAAFQAFKERLMSHPAGPIELHDGKPVHASTWKVTVLGYELQPGNGYGDNPVHVKPGLKKFNRFKNRLTQKLLAADPNDDLDEIGTEYWRGWYASQSAWTKVPEYSELVSSYATMSYVDDFRHNIPMGGNWTKGFSNLTAFYG